MSSVNVNLRQCSCALRDLAPTFPTKPHAAHCPAAPIFLPCPIPRSATFEVRLGDCRCGMDKYVIPHECPAIRVLCDVGGKTWEESDVMDSHLEHGRDTTVREEDTCREHWALVKAVLSGIRAASYFTEGSPLFTQHEALFVQRDAVFSALADMARAEVAAYEAEVAWGVAMKKPAKDDIRHPDPGFDAKAPSSRRRLATYVEHLIEQVGSLR